ncbi:MAG: helix-turn-helix domain-containing protein [Gammaproteobacteria bacterium]
MPVTRHIALVTFAGGNASAVAGPLDVLAFAREKAAGVAPIELTVLTPDGRAVACGSCMTLNPVAALVDTPPPDVVFLTGMPCDIDTVIDAHAGILGWLATQRARGAALATVCPSQALLAHGGMLDGHDVAMHWSLIDDARRRWPAVRWSADRMVIEDHGVYSCCGASATVDLALYLVDRLCGRDVMTACAQWFLADPPRLHRQLPPPPLALPRAPASNPAMGAVESWILGNFQQPVHFESLAAECMSWRTFYRHFQVAFGDSPKVYLQKLRLNAARRLLENDAAPIESIAARVGYGDAAFFRTLFKRHVGMTPSRYRESFRLRAVGGA